MRYFTPLFMEEAQRFLAQLDHSSRKKVLYDIELATQSIELRRFKKLRGEPTTSKINNTNETN